MTKAEKLRKLLAEKPILKIMGAHNALGAKLIERNGLDAVWASGFEISSAHGVPDANIMTMTENLAVASSINEATSLPVVCDCDTGYGNANNVMHMVRKYEAADMAAVVIEDKHFPKVNSFIPGRQELTSIEEFCGKIEAARSARKSDSGIMVIARIEALIAGWGMEEAIRRALAYHEAGADGIVIHSKSKTPDEIFTFSKLWKEKMGKRGVLVAIPTTYYKVTANELAREGFKIAIYANQGMRAIVKALNDTFSTIAKEGTTESIEKQIVSMQELFQLQGMHTHQEMEEKFSPKGEKITAVIPAAADHKFQPDLASQLKDIPLCMLDIAGKTLLDRQLDTLRSVGIYDFHVVTGYRKDKIQAGGIKKIENLQFESKGSAHSAVHGLRSANGKILLCYADIIFDRKIPEALLKSEYPITLVIDRAYKTLPRRDKVLDKVETMDSMDLGIRKMNLEPFKKIQKIGKTIPDSAQHEFIGMMLLSAEGNEILRRALTKIENEWGIDQGNKCSMTELIQYLIDSGQEIYGMVIEHGWSEIYSLDDYQRVNRFFTALNEEKNQPTPITL